MIFNEEQQLFRDAAREFAETEITPLIPQILEQGTLPEGLYGRAAELGLAGISASEEYGGAGQGHIEASIVLEEVSKSCPGLALALERSIVFSWALQDSKMLADKYLSGIADGSLRVGVSTSSPSAVDAGSFFAKADGGYRANGTCAFPANSDGDVLCVFGTDEDSAALCALIEKGWDGVGDARIDVALGQAGSNGGSVEFKEVFIPEENVLDAKALQDMEFMAFGCSAAEALGCAKGLFIRTRDFCQNRTHSGIHLTEMSSVRANLAELQSAISLCESLVYDCAQQADACGDDTSAAASWRILATSAKLRVSDILSEVAYECIKLNGGMGYHDPHLWHYLADALNYCLVDKNEKEALELLASLMEL